MSAEILNITAEESGERIDALLARSLTELSRSAAQRLIEEGRVTLDGRPVKKNKKTEAGEVYELELRNGRTEYDFEIDAQTGDIVSRDVDYDD